MAYSDAPMPLDRMDALAVVVVVVVAFVASVLYSLLTQYAVASTLVTWAWLLVAACFLYLLWRLVRAAERLADAME